MEDFVDFNLAKKLREKEFDWETDDVYERDILICRYEDYPKLTIYQVLKWLRKEKKIHISIDISYIVCKHGESMYKYRFYITNLSNHDRNTTLEDFDSFEECALAGINYALDYLI